ncbi:AraC family transcriptional regulator [Brevibacillus reuszeri]|uniref:helix-turn-helix domain-containing protein n=1 Tax=Brevibacillus reuszeri TaxID=54915 RepID=UPI001B221768|nr:AraC family transcriptional regulator [Brevibacillus reuszeri]GIO09311.1 AraC family transcriptional regulator [Brevibacillus reuszeri]
MDKIIDKFPKGVLHALIAEKKFSLTRLQPSAEIGHFVQHYWIVRWDLRGQAPYSQVVIAHPNVNLVFEKGASGVFGVAKTTSSHLLKEQGWVFGIKFKPGGFYPFLKAPVSTLTGSVIGLEEVFGVDTARLETEILSQPDDAAMLRLAEQFLTAHLPERDPNTALIADIVQMIQQDRTILRVEDVVRISGMNKRTMQRMFDRYVGVSPKSVIQRYRLHEAAERMDQGTAGHWLDLSIALGYYDHSHFIRDFRSIVGVSPEEYRQYR